MSSLRIKIALWSALATALLSSAIAPAEAAPQSELFDPSANVVLGRLQLGAPIDQVAQSLAGLVAPKPSVEARARTLCGWGGVKCPDPNVPLSATDLAQSMRQSSQLDCAQVNCKIPHDPLIVFDKRGVLSYVRIQFGSLTGDANAQARESYAARYGKPYLPSQDTVNDFDSGRVRHVVVPFGDGRVTLVYDMNVFNVVLTSVEYRDRDTAAAWIETVTQQRSGAGNPLLQ